MISPDADQTEWMWERTFGAKMLVTFESHKSLIKREIDVRVNSALKIRINSFAMRHKFIWENFGAKQKLFFIVN